MFTVFEPFDLFMEQEVLPFVSLTIWRRIDVSILHKIVTVQTASRPVLAQGVLFLVFVYNIDGNT